LEEKTLGAIIQTEPREQVQKPPLPKAHPCVIVIFGASGDLTRRKLIPALYDLACVGCIDRDFDIVGVGRTRMTNEEFRESMRKAAEESRDTRRYDDWRWMTFAPRLRYMVGDLNDLDLYPKLRAVLNSMRESGSSSNWLFYVATPSSVAGPIIRGLNYAGLNKNEVGWSRIVLEKPFGRDLNSARELNAEVLKVFDESAVYRIDHYLGKETVQNILVFRFGNSLFEPVWNRNYIDRVEITAAETLGVENRAAFYEKTGALRDMVANHLLQLLTLTAMEPPVAFEADAVREQKVNVLKSIRPMTVEEVSQRTVRGQYGAGTVGGDPVPGYREEPDVNPQSTIETYAALKLFVDNWRWAGVPFYVRTGKRLARQITDIRVQFKRTPQALFARTEEREVRRNIITLRIQPNEGISIAFGAKRPGPEMTAIPVQADFSYEKAFGGDAAPAYETLLLDAMVGDATLFTRADEVEAEWRIITPIENAWAELPVPKYPNYAAGSDGPDLAQELFEGQPGWERLAA
jgi:glucose-6-phosphate 1-dehydrogenase